MYSEGRAVESFGIAEPGQEIVEHDHRIPGRAGDAVGEGVGRQVLRRNGTRLRLRDKNSDLLGRPVVKNLELLAAKVRDGSALAVMRDYAHLHQFGRGTEGGIGWRLSSQY